VRTTLTLDDDVAAALTHKMRSSGEPLKQTVNRLLRAGLAYEASPKKLPRFKIRARKIGIPADWLGGSTQELFDRLDGPTAR
jgi:hypothetical protein